MQSSFNPDPTKIINHGRVWTACCKRARISAGVISYTGGEFLIHRARQLFAEI